MTIQNIDIVDEFRVDQALLAAIVAAVQIQVSEHAGPIWGFDAILSIQPSIRPGNWGLIIAENADVADALGYHELTAEGQPLAKVFWATDIEDKSDPATTASHEILETLGNPGCDGSVKDYSANLYYSPENADPVEDSTYLINGISVSDFVLPAWFSLVNPSWIGAAKGKYDWLGLCSEPFEVLPGGYTQIQKKPHGRWKTIFGSVEAASKFDYRRKHRATMRQNGVRRNSTR